MSIDPGASLLRELRAAAGRRHVIATPRRMRRYVTGYRYGDGAALAVVRPGTLVAMWRVLQACAKADVIVLMQAANTGLTGGSTPHGEYDRPVVIVSTLRLDTIHLVGGGREVICLPGVTLDQLERRLAPLGREPHSVIGSTCFGASVVGGVCNNSGGALLQRGPSYTEHALFAQRDARGALTLHDTLEIDLPAEPEDALAALEAGAFTPRPVRGTISASDYVDEVRRIDRATPARYNADPARLCGASGSAGHVAVFAVRLATFATQKESRTFQISTDDPDVLTALRRAVLARFPELPDVAEYVHRDAFILSRDYGSDVLLAIRWLGTRRLSMLYGVQSALKRVAGLMGPRAGPMLERATLGIAAAMSRRPEGRVADAQTRHAHHLLVKCTGAATSSMRDYLRDTMPAATTVIECTREEAETVFRERFVVASAGIRYAAVHARDTAGLVSLDVALPRNAVDWAEPLPPDIARFVAKRIDYGHFFCHVFHHDFILEPNCDAEEVKDLLLAWYDSRRAIYPAEHNVGHLYAAAPALKEHYHALDPTNSFNPGTGKLSRLKNWSDTRICEETSIVALE